MYKVADRRMISIKIIDTDKFIDMPATARLLYYDLSVRADDDGFIGSPKKITKMIGAAEDDLRILIETKFILTFESGVCVIRDWKIHNSIKVDRYQPTQYLAEKALLRLDINKAYELIVTSLEPNRNQSVPSLEPDCNQIGTSVEPDRSQNVPSVEPERNQSGSNLDTDWNQSGTEVEPERNQSGTKTEPQVRLGKVRLGKDRVSTVESGKSQKVEHVNSAKRFDEFWNAYPRKVGKGAAEQTFKKYKPSDELLKIVLTAIDEQKHSEQWRKDSGKYIPNPATWLNQKRWEDEVQIDVQQPRVTYDIAEYEKSAVFGNFER